MNRTLFAVASFAVAFLSICAAANESRFIILQSTTTTQNSGLLDYILPIFEKETGIEVRVVAVGTGQALRNAENGDGDVLLVHARELEDAFVDAGHGVERLDVMYNDFVIVGPPSDPAAVKGLSDAVVALNTIASSKSAFVSRGDGSGTHAAEMRLWRETAVDTEGASGTWYRETGAGMGTTLNIAVNMNAYALTDRGTWLNFQAKGDHGVLVEGDERLFNPYGVILVNPQRHPAVKAELGQNFIDWLVSDDGQGAIAAFQIDGQQPFFPNAAPQ